MCVSVYVYAFEVHVCDSDQGVYRFRLIDQFVYLLRCLLIRAKTIIGLLSVCPICKG